MGGLGQQGTWPAAHHHHRRVGPLAHVANGLHQFVAGLGVVGSGGRAVLHREAVVENDHRRGLLVALELLHPGEDGAGQAETVEEKQAEDKDSTDRVQDKAAEKTEETAAESESGSAEAGGAIASNWLLKAPVQAPANDAYVSYLTNLLVTSGRDRALEVSPDQLSEYGLDRPQATVEIRLKSQQTHTLRLGSANFDRTSLYAQVDPTQETADAIAVLLVPSDFENAINRSLTEWQAQNKEDAETPDEG